MVLDLFKLDGRVALVTGSTRGIGQAAAIALAEAGAHVVGLNRSDADETAEKIATFGGQFKSVHCDLLNTTTAEIQTIISGIHDEMGNVDILVNNAGIIRRAAVLDLTEQDWDDVLKVNLKSIFFLSQIAAKIMVQQTNGGKIIHIASMLSYQGGIRVPSYTAAKSGLVGLTRAMANELASRNINVNAIAPGYIATDNTEPLRNDENRNQAILDRIPAGRWGTPDDLKGAVVFLASEAARYMHGAVVPVDGGWLAR